MYSYGLSLWIFYGKTPGHEQYPSDISNIYYILALAYRQNFAVQSQTYCHKDSLFKDKVKPMRVTDGVKDRPVHKEALLHKNWNDCNTFSLFLNLFGSGF